MNRQPPLYAHVPSFLSLPIHMQADIRGKIQNEMIHIFAIERYKGRGSATATGGVELSSSDKEGQIGRVDSKET